MQLTKREASRGGRTWAMPMLALGVLTEPGPEAWAAASMRPFSPVMSVAARPSGESEMAGSTA